MTEQEVKERMEISLIAKEYHDRTEHFDRSVCTGKIKDGAILPANGKELSTINQHAKSVLRELTERSGIHISELREIVRIEEIYYRYDPDNLILPEAKSIRKDTTEGNE